jgi:hypothetical protein
MTLLESLQVTLRCVLPELNAVVVHTICWLFLFSGTVRKTRVSDMFVDDVADGRRVQKSHLVVVVTMVVSLNTQKCYVHPIYAVLKFAVLLLKFNINVFYSR